MKKNAVGWFEIPVTDMDRAIKFYSTVFDIELSQNLMGPLEMAWFPEAESGIGSSGSLVKHEQSYKPSREGVLIYFTAQSGDLSIELSKVEEAGGKILIPRRLITDEIGYMAVFLDTEGNRIAIHSKY